MSANNYYYTYDDCYIKQTTTTFTDACFNDYLARNYYHYTVARVKDCENKALRNNSEFFLINDISTSLNNIYTNCYIPKLDNNNNDTYTYSKNNDGTFNILKKGQPYVAIRSDGFMIHYINSTDLFFAGIGDKINDIQYEYR